MNFTSKSETQQALEAVLLKLELVERQMDEKMELVELQINELSARMASFPQPIRPRWVRNSRPAWEAETLVLPAAQRGPRQAHQPPPAIDKVTLCMSGAKQFVYSYDAAGNEIKQYSGDFQEVGMQVVALVGNKQWNIISEPA